MKKVLITLTWDPKAWVWTAESDDVSGLALEAGSFESLIERIHSSVPELLRLNEVPVTDLETIVFRENFEKGFRQGIVIAFKDIGKPIEEAAEVAARLLGLSREEAAAELEDIWDTV